MARIRTFCLSNRQYPETAHPLIGPGFLETKSEFAARMLEVIIFFTYAENLVGNIFVKITGPDAISLIDDFIQRPSSSRYAERLLAMGHSRVSAEDMISLRAIMRMFIDCYEERNIFAHWLCGVATEVPQGLLMVNPHHLWREQAAFNERAWESPAEYARAMATPMNKDEIYVYEIKHFSKINDKISALIKALSLMFVVQLHTDEQIRNQMRGQLYAISQFQKARASLPATEDPKKTRPLQQRLARLQRELRRAFRHFFE